MKPETRTYGGVTLDLSQVKCFIKQKYNETVEVDFPDFATASAYIKDWEDMWEKYLREQS